MDRGERRCGVYQVIEDDGGAGILEVLPRSVSACDGHWDCADIEGCAHVVDRVSHHHEAAPLDVAARLRTHAHDVGAVRVEVAEPSE